VDVSLTLDFQSLGDSTKLYFSLALFLALSFTAFENHVCWTKWNVTGVHIQLKIVKYA
jgi:hypothetical protein